MRIHDARHVGDIVSQLARHRIRLVVIRAADADVDRRRLAEIQNLVDDVGRLKEKLQFRETAAAIRGEDRPCAAAVGVCPLFSEIRISPSIGPTVAESLSAMLMPL